MNTVTVIVPYRHGTVPDRSRFPNGTVFSDDEQRGKKYALYKAVSAATTEWVWLTDDDVTFPAIPAAISLPEGADLVIPSIRMERARNTLLERLQCAEYAAIQSLTLTSAEQGHPVMCSGANLLVRRTAWLESYAEVHPEIAGGDDMFLLESFKRHGRTVIALREEALTLTITPVSTLSALFRQRMRWAGKAARYTDRDIRLCGCLVLIANLLQLVVPPILLIKFPLEWNLIRDFERRKGKDNSPQNRQKRKDHTSLGTALLLELVYPIYILICLIGGLLNSLRQTTRF